MKKIFVIALAVFAQIVGTFNFINFDNNTQLVSTPTVISSIQGKNVVTYGDSITLGQTTPIPPYTGDVNWPLTFSQITKSTVTNNGIGGSCMAVVGNPALDPAALCNRVDTEDLSVYDYMFICYGTNDCTHGVPIGDDSVPFTKTTFKGALNYVLDKVKKTYPELKVILLTPMFGNISFINNTIGLTLGAYCAAIQEVATEYSVPVIDLQNGMGINADNFQSLYWDGELHPNESTYMLMGEFIAQSLTGIGIPLQPADVPYWNPIMVVAPETIRTTNPSFFIAENNNIKLRGIVVQGSSRIGYPSHVGAYPDYDSTLSCSAGDRSITSAAIYSSGQVVISLDNQGMTYPPCLPLRPAE